MSKTRNLSDLLDANGDVKSTALDNVPSPNLTGIDDNADATAITIDSNEQVGIGTTSPSKLLHVSGGGTTPTLVTGDVIVAQNNANTTDDCYVTLIAGTSGNSRITFGDADDSDVGKIKYNHSNNDLMFDTNNQEHMRITSSGRIGMGENTPTGSLHIRTRDSNGSDVFVVTQSETNNRQSGYKCLDENGNIGLVMKYDNGSNNAVIHNSVNGNISLYLGGTGNANMIDDYEEGTWTPVLRGDNWTGSLNYNQQQGIYIKIGRLVFVSAFIGWTQNNFTASSGRLDLQGLPFTASSQNVYRGGVPITYASGAWSGLTIYQQAFRVESNATKFGFNFSDATDGAITTEVSNHGNVGSNGSIMIGGSYAVD